MKAGAVIVAGGRGMRMGTDIPKQLLTLGGKTILERTLTPFINSSDIVQIVIVAEKSIRERIETFIEESLASPSDITVVTGGATRQESVFNGISRLSRDIDVIVIHDAVRPFITGELLKKCISSAHEHGAVSVMRPVTETVKVVNDGLVIETPDRYTLWITQTPQAFKRTVIVAAHQKATDDDFTGTDDCMLVERMGHAVHVVEGNDMNIKITTKTDLKIAESILEQFEDGRFEC